ncbi:unnamed protein product [Owenia fusiformis]|uniref:Uncharacterized protein n=1 Tax=Owenia fusiformis TaxID=6347 RepID=A0A8J1XW29_OWEFU|nr:unnamed protein product [Owenia fusiformis]
MVSIPDWSKLARLTDVKLAEPLSASRYNKQRELEVVKQAEKHGYFVKASKSYILQKFKEADPDQIEKDRLLGRKRNLEEECQDVEFIKLPGTHLRHLGDIARCENLKICCLSNNYISRIESLMDCHQLIKLDLHSNQISMLPPAEFWAGMQSLKLLNLHDNPIGKMENIHHIAACPKLMGLTLFDTPLSLRKNYRHHIVNSIWSLRALDKHVISDEEIIEDADFGGRFSAQNVNLRIDLCPFTWDDVGYDEETTVVKKVLQEINSILSHTSPVLVIQRFVRGWITRRTYKLIQDTRIWAAVTIQRYWRTFHGYPHPRDKLPPPPSTSPVLDTSKIDYDTYMKLRRPSSANVSEKGGAKADKSDTEMRAQSSPNKARKSLLINLSKLQQGTLQTLQDEAIAIETVLPHESSYYIQRRSKTEIRKRKRKEKKKQRRIMDIKHFFGPVVEPSPPSPVNTTQFLDDTSDPYTPFRLQGYKSNVMYVDPTTEAVISKADSGKNIREAEHHYHRSHLDEKSKPKTKHRQHKKTASTDQRIFARVHGTMGMSCLRAVQQAYKDRERAEKVAMKLETVLTLKERREDAKERIRIYHEEKRADILKKRQKEHSRLVENMERREIKRINEIEKSLELRNKTSDFLKSSNMEKTFISDFTRQNTSVSNALLRHDRQSKKDDHSQNKEQIVQGLKEEEKEEADLVKKYLEHRQLMRQTETAALKATLDSQLLQDANDRLMEARTRVARLKKRTETVNTFYPMPSGPDTQLSLPPLDTAKQPEKLDRWNTMISMQSGRVGKHPTTIVN